MNRPDINTEHADRVYVGKNTTVADVIKYIDWLENAIDGMEGNVEFETGHHTSRPELDYDYFDGGARSDNDR